MPTEPDHEPAASADDYRAALRHYAAGVTIVTMWSTSGPVGFTATSLASVSLSPPLVSFNVSHTSSSHAALHAADSVVIHILGAHQAELARRFSATAAERFADDASWQRLPSGEPVLHGTPLSIRARIDRVFEVGDHSLVIARVDEVRRDSGADSSGPLVYYNGRYLRVEPVVID